MAATKVERAILDIQEKMSKITGIADTHEKLKSDVARLNKTVYDNGLNSKVQALHDDMLERKEKENEYRAEKVKSNLTLRNLMIGTILTVVLNLVVELMTHR